MTKLEQNSALTAKAPRAPRKVTARGKAKGKEPATSQPSTASTAIDNLANDLTVRLVLNDDDNDNSVADTSPAVNVNEDVAPSTVTPVSLPYQRTMYRAVLPIGAQEIKKIPVHVSGSVAQGYFSLLQDFRTGYPDSTNIHCWWCCYPFEGKPIGVPRKMFGTAECFQCIGCFCSFACACAYAKNDKDLSSSLTLLNMAYRHESKANGTTGTTGTNAKPRRELGNPGWVRVESAPPREALQRFGGQMTITEFRKASSSGQSWRLLQAPMMPWPMFAEDLIAKQSTTSYTRNGMQRPLEIRKSNEIDARVNALNISNIPSLRPSPMGPSTRRTAIDQLISFA